MKFSLMFLFFPEFHFILLALLPAPTSFSFHPVSVFRVFPGSSSFICCRFPLSHQSWSSWRTSASASIRRCEACLTGLLDGFLVKHDMLCCMGEWGGCNPRWGSYLWTWPDLCVCKSVSPDAQRKMEVGLFVIPNRRWEWERIDAEVQSLPRMTTPPPWPWHDEAKVDFSADRIPSRFNSSFVSSSFSLLDKVSLKHFFMHVCPMAVECCRTHSAEQVGVQLL